MSSSDSRPLPQRTHSVNAFTHANYISSLDEELRDCKRVQRQGQEEDLREALNRMMARVEEMCAMLKSSYQATADLETQLTLAESNLKLALANNEMLEDALKNGSLSKDVGWRRSSREPGSTPLLAAVAASPPPPTSASSSQTHHQTCIDENEAQGALDSPPGSDRDSRAASPAPPTIQNDTRFFRFRFAGSGRTTPTQPPNSPPPPPPRAQWTQRTSPATGHLTSASLPSLVAPLPVANGELDELREQLLVEKRKSDKIAHEKKELEGELENLSQALFEEANKMVAVERIKRAEAEDELKDVHAEKDALRAALRLIEEDRVRAESSRAPHVNGVDGSYSQYTNAPTHSRTSSCEAIVSPRLAGRDPPSPPSPPPPTAQSESQSPMGLGTTTPLDEAPPSPAPLYVPPPHLAESPPTSRTGSPMPLPHPHRLSTHLRPAAPAPAPPPPSAADGFPISPWACPPREQDEADEDAVDFERTGFSVPQIVTPSSEAEMTAPWGKW